MTGNIQVGDRVKLLGLPDWLTHDLPENEQKEMHAFVGQCAVVDEIDPCGYFWLGFGSSTEFGDAAHYSGHSFGVPKECIQLEL